MSLRGNTRRSKTALRKRLRVQRSRGKGGGRGEADCPCQVVVLHSRNDDSAKSWAGAVSLYLVWSCQRKAHLLILRFFPLFAAFSIPSFASSLMVLLLVSTLSLQCAAGIEIHATSAAFFLHGIQHVQDLDHTCVPILINKKLFYGSVSQRVSGCLYPFCKFLLPTACFVSHRRSHQQTAPSLFWSSLLVSSSCFPPSVLFLASLVHLLL